MRLTRTAGAIEQHVHPTTGRFVTESPKDDFTSVRWMLREALQFFSNSLQVTYSDIGVSRAAKSTVPTSDAKFYDIVVSVYHFDLKTGVHNERYFSPHHNTLRLLSLAWRLELLSENRE